MLYNMKSHDGKPPMLVVKPEDRNVLTIFQTASKDLQLMQTSWATQLNPVIASPLSTPLILKSVKLINGTTTINHRLGKGLTGWMIVRQRGPASIYDTQDTNQQATLTLQLVSSAAVTVDILVF